MNILINKKKSCKLKKNLVFFCICSPFKKKLIYQIYIPVKMAETMRHAN